MRNGDYVKNFIRYVGRGAGFVLMTAAMPNPASIHPTIPSMINPVVKSSGYPIQFIFIRCVKNETKIPNIPQYITRARYDDERAVLRKRNHATIAAEIISR